MSLQVEKVDAGGAADSLALPLVQVLHCGHAVEHLVADHLGPQGDSLPPDLQDLVVKYFEVHELPTEYRIWMSNGKNLSMGHF